MGYVEISIFASTHYEEKVVFPRLMKNISLVEDKVMVPLAYKIMIKTVTVVLNNSRNTFYYL